MNKVLMLLVAFAAIAIQRVTANDSCVIRFNKQIVFKGEVDQEDAVARLARTTFKPSDCITISYFTENASTAWERTFYLNDASENTVKAINYTKQSGTVSVKASILNGMKAKNQPVLIYTVSLPKDKAMAASVRVRRMFICKIEWN
jgi:hypothetical protein